MKNEEKRESWIFVLLGLFVVSSVISNVSAGLYGTHWYIGANVYLKGIETILCSFHMQLFFLIVGYLYGKRESSSWRQYRSFVGKHLLEVGVFYLFWSVLYWVVKYVSEPFVNQKMTFTHLFSVFVRPIEFLWLIYAYFWVFLIVTLLMQILEKKQKCKWLLGAFFIILFVPFVVSVKIPALYYIVRYSFYFYVGARFVKKKEKKENEIGILVPLLGILFYIFLASQMGFELGKTVLSVFSSITGSLFVFLLGYSLKDRQPSEWSIKVMNFLQKTGQAVAPMYLLHIPVLAAVRILLGKMGFGFQAIWLQFPLGIFAAWCLPFFFYQAVRKIKWIDTLFYPEKYIK